MTGPVVIVDAAGITVRHDTPLSASEARHVALRLLEAATGSSPRVLRRPARVDERLRERDD